MSRRWVIPICGLLVAISLCGGCFWSCLEHPRFSSRHDIGAGRTLTVWSSRRDTLKGLLRGQGLDLDPNPLMLYYRVDAGNREIIPATFLDHDDEGEYQFQTASADGGRLVCVFEPSRAENSFLFLMFDATTQESWPRTWREAGGDFRQAAAKWRDRCRRLRAENPGLPTPPDFRQE